jgi:hypothetical protein
LDSGGRRRHSESIRAEERLCSPPLACKQAGWPQQQKHAHNRDNFDKISAPRF